MVPNLPQISHKNVTDINKLIDAFINYAIVKFSLKGHLHIEIILNLKITKLEVFTQKII